MNEWFWFQENLKCPSSDWSYYNFWTHVPEATGNHGFRRYLDTMIHQGEVYVRLWVDFIPIGIYTHQEWI